jgi:ABC-type nitrate/sulfonate/bicarbonate transport system substrate-binding protein
MPQRAFLAMADAGVEVKAIMVNTWGAQMQLIVPPNSPVKKVADLAGRRVVLSRGSSALPVLIRLLNQAGLAHNELTISEVPAAQLAKALPNGQTDAVFDVAHVTAPLVGGGLGRSAIDPDAVRKELGLIDAMPVVASARFLEREPETARRVVTAWVQAQQYIHREPEDCARLLRIFLHRHGLTAEQALVDAWIGLQRYDRPLWTQHAISDAEYNGWGLKEVGMLEKIPDLAKFVDNRFLERVTNGANARPRSGASNRR